MEKSFSPTLLKKDDIWGVGSYSGVLVADSRDIHRIWMDARKIKEKIIVRGGRNRFCNIDVLNFIFPFGDYS
jgi:hypothetical protein